MDCTNNKIIEKIIDMDDIALINDFIEVLDKIKINNIKLGKKTYHTLKTKWIIIFPKLLCAVMIIYKKNGKLQLSRFDHSILDIPDLYEDDENNLDMSILFFNDDKIISTKEDGYISVSCSVDTIKDNVERAQWCLDNLQNLLISRRDELYKNAIDAKDHNSIELKPINSKNEISYSRVLFLSNCIKNMKSLFGIVDEFLDISKAIDNFGQRETIGIDPQQELTKDDIVIGTKNIAVRIFKRYDSKGNYEYDTRKLDAKIEIKDASQDAYLFAISYNNRLSTIGENRDIENKMKADGYNELDYFKYILRHLSLALKELYLEYANSFKDNGYDNLVSYRNNDGGKVFQLKDTKVSNIISGIDESNILKGLSNEQITSIAEMMMDYTKCNGIKIDYPFAFRRILMYMKLPLNDRYFKIIESKTKDKLTNVTENKFSYNEFINNVVLDDNSSYGDIRLIDINKFETKLIQIDSDIESSSFYIQNPKQNTQLYVDSDVIQNKEMEFIENFAKCMKYFAYTQTYNE